MANISLLVTVDRERLDGRIGELRRSRLEEVIQGIYTLLRSVDRRGKKR